MKRISTFYKRIKASQKSAVADVFHDILNGCLGAGILDHVFLYLLGGVHDCGVVSAAAFLTDGGHGKLGDVPNHIHGDLTGVGNRRIALGGTDIIGGDAEGAAHFFDDLFDGDRRRLCVYGADGVRTREERESLIKKFSPQEEKNGREDG